MMKEWKEVKLGNVVNITPGFAFKSKDFGKEGCIVIKIKDICPPAICIDNAEKINLDNYNVQKLKKYILSKGDYVIAMTGATIGKIGRLKTNELVYINQRVAKIKAIEGYSNDFIYYSILSKDFQYFIRNNIDSNSAQENISSNSISRYTILLPPLPEQKAIAAVLSSLDDKIDLLHRQNKTLEQMAEVLFRQWFVEEAKEGWKEQPLSSIANFLNGLACQKYPPQNEIDKLPVLKIKELRNGISKDSDWATTNINPEYLVENGDVIFSWSASLMIKIWNGEKCILNQHLFRVTSDKFPKWFYYLWSKHHLNQFMAIAKAHATTMGHIKRGDLDDAIILTPSKKELEQMTKKIEPIIEKVIINQKQIHNLVKLRDTLLPKLMSGEVRVSM